MLLAKLVEQAPLDRDYIVGLVCIVVVILIVATLVGKLFKKK